jgi:hypothetical protein
MPTRQIAPSTSVWFKVDSKRRIAASVESRQGGAYRIKLPGTLGTRIVNRHQMVLRRVG